MKKTMRRVLALAAAMLMLPCLGGCTGKAERAAAQAEYEKAMQEYARQQAELDALRERVEHAENNADEYIAAINATVNGERFALVNEGGEYTAQAVLPEGMRVDYWLINGERVEGGESVSVPAVGGTVVEAVLRPEKWLRAVDAKMCLIDADGSRVGESFTELCFEDMESVSVCIYAETDDLTTVDHWIVNGVALDAYGYILEFYARDLTEATTFVPVFAACYTQHEAADPTPRYQQVPLRY